MYLFCFLHFPVADLPKGIAAGSQHGRLQDEERPEKYIWPLSSYPVDFRQSSSENCPPTHSALKGLIGIIGMLYFSGKKKQI